MKKHGSLLITLHIFLYHCYLQILVPGTVSEKVKTYLKKYHMLAKQVELQKKNIMYSIHVHIQTLTISVKSFKENER